MDIVYPPVALVAFFTAAPIPLNAYVAIFKPTAAVIPALPIATREAAAPPATPIKEAKPPIRVEIEPPMAPNAPCKRYPARIALTQTFLSLSASGFSALKELAALENALSASFIPEVSPLTRELPILLPPRSAELVIREPEKARWMSPSTLSVIARTTTYAWPTTAIESPPYLANRGV